MPFSSKDKDDKKMIKFQVFFSKKHEEQLRYYAKRHGLPMSQLVAMAIDNELFEQKERIPFKWNLKFSDDQFEEYTWANEAGKIMNFLKDLQYTGMSLTQLLICRHDFGVPDKEVVKNALKELLDKEMIEEFSKYYLKHVGSDDELATGYLTSINILKDDIAGCERIINYYDRINKNSKQLASRHGKATFNPW